ncbi:hypothetical protein [Acinetobacter sp. A47]|uniref:hypothetical protein n=1 Tax=Acinetobacter sp. A47 TaxID=1561217 RepID=UPI00056E51F7|nr:hypothetical protein [Acinetobacter sp. A47]
MGLFGSSKKTHVYTSVARMVEDKDIRVSSQTAVVEHVLNSTLQIESDVVQMSLTDHIRAAAMNSLPAKMDKFYRWAKSGQYHYGLPKSSVVHANSKLLTTEVQAILEGELGTTVVMDYVQLGEPNYYHFAWKILIDKFQYSPETNELRSISPWHKSSCFLKDLQIFYTEDTISRVTDTRYFEQWGIAATAGATPSRLANPEAEHTTYAVDAKADKDYAKVTYEYKDSKGNITTDTQIITFEQYINSGDENAMEGMESETTAYAPDPVINESDYVMGCGVYTKAGKETRYYFTYVFGSGGYLSLDRILESHEDTGQFYPRLYARLNNQNLADSRLKETDAFKSSKSAGRKMDLEWQGWVDQIHEAVENTKNIRQCFLMLGLPANTKDQLTLKYLFKYFHRLYSGSEQPRISRGSDSFKQEFATYAVKGGSSIVIEDEAFRQVLSYSSIGLRDIRGSIGAVGTYKLERGRVRDNRGIMRLLSVDYHAYQFQITETTYREVRVYGLSFTEQVSGGHSTVSKGDSENLLIPLDRSMRNEFSTRERESIYAKSLHIVFNTLQVVKKKWYATGLFKVVMFIVAVVLSVFTGGQSITLYTVAMAAVQAVVIGIALSALAKLAVKIGINVKIVAVVAVIAMAYGGYLNLSNTTGMFNVTASTMLQASNAAFNFSAKVGQYEIKEIAKDQLEFENSVKDKEEALKQAQELLGKGPMVDGTFFLDQAPPSSMPYLNLYQTPNEYYTRTVHSGNAAVISLDMIASYVEQALTPPSASKTLEFLQGM